MSQAEGGTAEDHRPHVMKTYTLNSMRLTADIVNRIAKGLGLPSKASLADTQQMIEGKTTAEHEPKNVQIEVTESGSGTTRIQLQDEGGVILEIPPEEENRSTSREASTMGSASESKGEAGGERNDMVSRVTELEAELESGRERTRELESELEQMRQRSELAAEENATLSEEVSVVRGKVRQEKDKHTALWRMNCEQLAEYDEAITSKDGETEALRGRVEMLETHPGSELVLGPVHGGGTRDKGRSGVGELVHRAGVGGAVVPVSTLAATPHHARKGSTDQRGRCTVASNTR